MDQAGSLSDLLSNGPAISGALSSPANNAGADDVTGGLFSTLVSGADVSPLPPLAQNQEAAAQPSIPLSLPTEDAPTVPTTSADTLIQSASKLSVALQQALAILQSGSVDVSALSAGETEQAAVLIPSFADTQTENVSGPVDALTSAQADRLLSSVSSIAGDLTDAAQIAGDSKETFATKTFSDVIAELLTLMQLVVQTLQQAATGGGTSAGTENAAAALTFPAEDSNGLIPETLTPPGLLALQPADSSPAESLLDLLKTAAADAKQVLGSLTEASAGTTLPAETTIEPVVSETTVSFAQLETGIEAALSHLKENSQAAPTETTPSAPKTPATPDAANAALAAQGTVEPFLAAETTAQTVASLPTVAAKTTETKTALAEKTKTASIKTEVSPESKKPETPSIVADPALVAAFLGESDAGDNSSASGGSQSDEKGFSLSATGVNLTPAFTAEGAQAKGVYSFASTLSAFRAAHGGLTGLTSIADQVILHMNRSVKNGASQISLQLQPSDLGKISVKLDFGADGKVQGTVVADNPKTLEMLQKDSRSLERALQDAGLRAEPGSLEFSLSGRESQNSAGQTASGAGNEAGDGTISAGNEGTEIVDIGAISETYYITPTGVNIRV